MPLAAPLLFACSVCANPASSPAAAPPRPDAIAVAASADVRSGGWTVGEGDAAQEIDEWRLEARLGVRPIPALEISVGVPLLIRALELAGEVRRGSVPGDVDVVLAGTAYSERKGDVQHTVVVRGLTKFPTAPVQTGAGDEFLPSSLQPGCASVVPGVHGTYVVGWGAWAFEASLGVLVPFAVLEGPHRGASFQQLSRFEYRPVKQVALSLGWRWFAETTGDDGLGSPEDDSGGLIGYAAPSIEVTVPNVFTSSVGVDVPAVEALRGAQEPTFIAFARMGGSWDVGRASGSAPRVEQASAR